MWEDHAACKGQDTRLFFPKGIVDSRLKVSQIKQDFCDRCPVKAACYQYAKENDIRYGIWGGYHFLEDNPARA